MAKNRFVAAIDHKLIAIKNKIFAGIFGDSSNLNEVRLIIVTSCIYFFVVLALTISSHRLDWWRGLICAIIGFELMLTGLAGLSESTKKYYKDTNPFIKGIYVLAHAAYVALIMIIGYGLHVNNIWQFALPVVIGSLALMAINKSSYGYLHKYIKVMVCIGCFVIAGQSGLLSVFVWFVAPYNLKLLLSMD